MVVTRLLEVTSKGSEWVNAKSTTTTTSIETKPIRNGLNSTSSSSYWNYATTTIQDMASNAIGSMVSSLYGGGNCSSSTPVNYFNMPQQQHLHQQSGSESNINIPRNTTSYLPSFWNFGFWNSADSAPSSSYRSVDPTYNTMRSDDDGNDYEEDDILYNTPRNSAYPTEQHHHHRRRSSIFAFNANDSSPWLSNSNNSGKNATPHSDLVWMFRNNKNPYNAVRGRESQLSSLTAVRSLVALVAATTTTNNTTTTTILNEDSEKTMIDDDNKPRLISSLESLDVPPPPPPYEMLHDDSLVSRDNRDNIRRLRTSRQNKIGVSTPSETASQLAEGSIRALRDLALEEAVGLQEALRYWNYRWERPLLSWLEAGPFGKIMLVAFLHFRSL